MLTEYSIFRDFKYLSPSSQEPHTQRKAMEMSLQIGFAC